MASGQPSVDDGPALGERVAPKTISKILRTLFILAVGLALTSFHQGAAAGPYASPTRALGDSACTLGNPRAERLVGGAGYARLETAVTVSSMACPDGPTFSDPLTVGSATHNYLLAENFDSFNASRWQKRWHWNGDAYHGGGELQAYRGANVKVANGLLALTAKSEPTRDFQGRTVQYTSGMIQSNGIDPTSGAPAVPAGFTFTYGRVEARIRIPKGAGWFPALWLCDAAYRERCNREIDVAEWLGRDPTWVHGNYHWRDLGLNGGQAFQSEVPLGDSFHVYAVDWRPSAIVWYVDGVEYFRYEGPGIPSNPHYLILNLAVGGTWSGPPDSSTLFPSSMLVDWIRVTA